MAKQPFDLISTLAAHREFWQGWRSLGALVLFSRSDGGGGHV